MAVTAALVLSAPAHAGASRSGPSAEDLDRIHAIHDECNSWACVRRVRAARIHRLGYPCKTWRCVRKIKARRLARRPFYGPVQASWYGPGLYGNRTACGQTLTPATYGVAHKSFACGTLLTLCAARCARVPVIDRGPYVGARVFDITGPAKNAIGMGDLGSVRYRIG